MNPLSKFCLKAQSTQWKSELPHPVVCVHVTMYLTPLSTAFYSSQDVVHLGLDVPKYKSYFCHFLSTELGVKFIVPNPNVI